MPSQGVAPCLALRDFDTHGVSAVSSELGQALTWSSVPEMQIVLPGAEPGSGISGARGLWGSRELL